MIPPLIIKTAVEKGINLIAITDHNSSANIGAVISAAKGTEVKIMAGMELQTKEEVHVLCLFDDLDQVLVFQKIIDAKLPDFPNDPEHFGEQFIIDETGDFIRNETRLLSTSADISIKSACEQVSELGGLFIPAHIDRDAYGLITVLGFVPPDIHPDALELSKHIHPKTIINKFPQIQNFPLIQSGDAHFLDDILGWNQLNMEKPTIMEIRKALNGVEGRSYKNISNP